MIKKRDHCQTQRDLSEFICQNSLSLLVGCINPLATGTGYLRDFIIGARTFDEDRARKVRAFYSHTILDHWTPHFTVLDPYSGSDAGGIASVLTRLTEDFQEFTIDTVCLLVQEHEKANWSVYREFLRHL